MLYEKSTLTFTIRILLIFTCLFWVVVGCYLIIYSVRGIVDMLNSEYMFKKLLIFCCVDIVVGFVSILSGYLLFNKVANYLLNISIILCLLYSIVYVMFSKDTNILTRVLLPVISVMFCCLSIKFKKMIKTGNTSLLWQDKNASGQQKH